MKPEHIINNTVYLLLLVHVFVLYLLVFGIVTVCIKSSFSDILFFLLTLIII